MNELFLYDKQAGLFQAILSASPVMEGRYHVSPNKGKDLDANNLETFLKDAMDAVTDVSDKYPICVCLPPYSRVERSDNEIFTFTLFFVTTTYYENNAVKFQDPDSGLSTHHVWYDWQDMKTAAENFINALDKVIRKRSITIDSKTYPLGTWIALAGDVVYRRLSRFNNDRLSGVSLSFNMIMNTLSCENDEYDDTAIDSIIIPSAKIHTHP